MLMHLISEERKWNWLDAFLFFIRTFWIYFNAAHVIGITTEDSKKWLFFLWFLAIYLVPYLFYRPGWIKIPYYLAAEFLLTGGMFLLLMHHVQSIDVYDFLYLPMITIAYTCQRKPLVWLGPSIGIALFFSGTWLGNMFKAENHIFGELINICFFYGFGFVLGRVTVLNNKMEVLIKSINEKNRILEQYSNRIEELTIMEERNRVSQDLHDTVGHVFTSVITSLDALPFLLKANPKEAETSIIEISGLARKGLDDVRKTIHQLSPLEEHQALSEAFESVIKDFRKHTGTNVDFTIEGIEPAMGERVKFTLIRCLQESLTNAKRHGRATHIAARLIFLEESVIMQLQDNGLGSDELKPGFGLVSMNDRLTALNGTIEIYSKVNQGTKIICTIPLAGKRML